MYHVTELVHGLEVTQLSVVCGQGRRPFKGTQPIDAIEVVIQEDQDGDLGLLQ